MDLFEDSWIYLLFDVVVPVFEAADVVCSSVIVETGVITVVVLETIAVVVAAVVVVAGRVVVDGEIVAVLPKYCKSHSNEKATDRNY